VPLSDPLSNQEKPPAAQQIADFCRYTVTTLLMDELEIACWIKFTDKFNFQDQAQLTINAQEILEKFLWNLFYIAVATKNILNDD